MAIMLAVDVLGCTGTNEERAGLLHKIIQIAAELKSTMGNMFGFAAVMRALELPQVNNLRSRFFRAKHVSIIKPAGSPLTHCVFSLGLALLHSGSIAILPLAFVVINQCFITQCVSYLLQLYTFCGPC